MIQFCVYTKNTGEILRSGIAPSKESSLAQAGDNEAVLFEPANDEFQYVDLRTKQITDKLELPHSYEVNGLVASLTRLPPNTDVIVQGRVQGVVNDSQATIDFDQPMEATIVLRNRPKYKDVSLTVTLG